MIWCCTSVYVTIPKLTSGRKIGIVDCILYVSQKVFYVKHLISQLLLSLQMMYICDRFEQKQADGWVLTNPLNATPLRPASTFIDGFSRALYQKIADFNSFDPLRYQF